jgi:hypothetical protein
MSFNLADSSKAKRERLLAELKSGRQISACQMVQIAGLQYGARVSELRRNAQGCFDPHAPEGLEHGANIVNDSLDPKRPDHTIFYLLPGHWKKRPSGRSRYVSHLVQEIADRDDVMESRKGQSVNTGSSQKLTKLTAECAEPLSLFGDLAPVPKDRTYTA